MATAHEIDYKIYGEELQFVEIELDPNESAIAESGAFMMMDNGIEMQTIFGDGSQQQGSGLLGKLLSAGKRLLVGESLFMTAFTNVGQGKKGSASRHLIPVKSLHSTCNSWAAKSSHKKTLFFAPPKASASASNSNANWARAFLVARVLSWKSWKATDWHLPMRVDT